jgi:hypothetical protein
LPRLNDVLRAEARLDLAAFEQLDPELQTLLREAPENLSARHVKSLVAAHGVGWVRAQMARQFRGYRPPKFTAQHRASGEPRRRRAR